MDTSKPTYQRLLAAERTLPPADPEGCQVSAECDVAQKCAGSQRSALLKSSKHKHKLSVESQMTASTSYTEVQNAKSKDRVTNRANGKLVIDTFQEAEQTKTIFGSAFADRVAEQNRKLKKVEFDQITQPPSVISTKKCQIQGCAKSANAENGGGHCNFSILCGAVKGCGRDFCSEHTGTRNSDEGANYGDDDFFQANNYDDEYGPSHYKRQAQSTRSCSTRDASFEFGDNYSDVTRTPTSSHQVKQRFDEEEEQELQYRPFDGQVCEECRPRLMKAYKRAIAIVVGVPALIAIICLLLLGGQA